MKQEFKILRDRPRLSIRLTRDSVCAADDCYAPHEMQVETYSFLDPTVLVTNLYAGYLPSVDGKGPMWKCFLNDCLIATIDDRDVVPVVLHVVYAEENHLHFQRSSARGRSESI